MTTKLNNQQPEQLNDSDKKQAKKLAKKKNMSPEDANHQKFIEKNKKLAENLMTEFEEKLNNLGFIIGTKIDPIVMIDMIGYKARLRVSAMKRSEYEEYKEVKRKKLGIITK